MEEEVDKQVNKQNNLMNMPSEILGTSEILVRYGKTEG